MFSTQQYFGFDPRTIPSCQLWLDAADTGTITLSGQNVTAWRDKSGLNNNASAVGTIPFTSNINGITTPAFTLQANTYFTGTTVNTGNTLTAFAVYIQSNTSTNNSRIVSLARSGVDWNVTSNVAAILMVGSSFCSYRNSSLLSTITGTFGVPSLSVALFTGSSNTFFLNGTAGTTVASSGNFDYTTYRIATAFGEESATTLSGTVGEVILYNSALTTSQRQQIEGYLAWKWRLQTNLPIGHPSKAYPTTMREFQPIDISGCALWLDAADTTSMTLSGSNVSVWRDKSGSGNNTTTATGPPLVSNSAINGRSAIRLQTGSYFAIEPLTTPANQTTVSAFVVATVTSNASSYGRLLSYGRTADGTTNNDFSTASNFTFLRESTTQSMAVYRNSPSVVPNRTLSITYGTPFLMECIFDGTNGNPFLNGGSNATFASTGTFTFNRLGIGYNINTKTDPTDVYNGLVGEVIVYYTALSTSQRQQVEGYLIRKWGLELPFAISSPLSIPGCQLWLDAADTTSTSMTLSGGNVSVWRDKSGNGNNTTTATGPPLLSNSAINGRSAIRLQTGSYFAIEPLTNAANQTTVSAFVVATMTSNSVSYGRLFSTGRIADGTANNDFQTTSNFTLARDNLNQSIAVFRNVPNAVANSSFAITYGSPFLMEIIFDGTNGNPFLNGTSNTAFSSTGTFTFNRLGIGYNINTKTDPNEVYTGLVGEVIVYYTALSTTQRQQIETYLGSKWGITTVAPSQSSYLLQRSIPSTQLFAPPLLSNLSLWLDAADSNTFTFSSGSNIIQWRDKSSTSNHLSALSGTTTRSGFSVVLSSSFMTFTTPALFSGTTGTSVFFVFSTPSNIENGHPIGYNNGGGSLTHLNWSDNILYDTIGFSTRQTVGTVFPGNTNQIYTNIANRGGNTLILRNGNQVYSATYGNVYAGSREYRIGSFSSSQSFPFTGVLYEIVYYSTTLTLSQQQQVEGYLAWKWGLQNSLPTTHPYYKFRP